MFNSTSSTGDVKMVNEVSGVGLDRRGRRVVLGGLAGERVHEEEERGGGGDGC